MSWLPLVGHESCLAMLRNAAARGRLGQAYLLIGPDGIGKRRFARHVAQGLLCETRPAAKIDPCGECGGCVSVKAGTHPDFYEAGRPAEKNQLPIETIQELCSRLALRPARGDRKVAILDDADFLNEESANAFLKTLEEPPPGSLLMLAGTSVETQLTTIVSRCQVLTFQPLTAQQVAGLLMKLEVVADPADAARLAGWASGSVAFARLLASEHWTEFRRRWMEGLSQPPFNAQILQSLATSFADSAGKDAAAKRTGARQAVGLAIEIFRAGLHRHCGARAEGQDLDAAGRRLADRLDAQTLLDLLERSLQADLHLSRFLNQPLALECWLDDLAQIAAGVYTPTSGGRLAV